MAYAKNPTWVDGTAGGTPITAASLQHIEDGLAAAALVYAATVSGSSSTATPPAGFTEAGDRSTGTRPLTLGYKLGVPAGASGSVGVTFTGSGNLIGALLVVRPSGAADTGIKIWAGTAWAPASVKRWTGTAWA